MRWRDITLPIGPEEVAWTGLEATRLRSEASIAEGAYVNVARLECSLHTGTHADAPYHVATGAPAIDAVDPRLFIGRARLLRVAGTDITRAHLEAAGAGPGMPPRLLLATNLQYDGRAFPQAIPVVAPEALTWLIGLGVRLLGVNVPSVDALESKELPNHHALFACGGAVLENLNLIGVPAGDYRLVAPPVSVKGGDAAPCRALLRKLPIL
jgi:arylformamidase